MNLPDSCQVRDEFNLLQPFSVIPEVLAINLTAACTFYIILYFMLLPAVKTECSHCSAGNGAG